MKILFANIPFIVKKEGEVFTGPNAGSRWPWTHKGTHFHDYAPFPFWLGYAARYVHDHGFECYLYDGVAAKHYDLEFCKQIIEETSADIVFFDVATPTFKIIDDIAKWTKETTGARIVYCGPHMKAYAEECIKLDHVDHCVIGEYEIAALDICQKKGEAKEIYKFEHLTNIDELPSGQNFTPIRPANVIHNYYDPSMATQKIQLTINTSRGCPFKCTYCQWPNVINNGQYRSRSVQNVLDEIIEIKGFLGDNLKSIFFDDDTWNLGKKRMEEMCEGLKKIGLPWTMMGRIDTSKTDIYDLMVDSGCVGMRFGVETFNQQLSDNVKKKMNVEQAEKNLRHLVTKYKNMEFHFTTMKNLPGEKAGSWERDQDILKDLERVGRENNNRVHWQIADCIPFPGTELWEELIDLGHGESLKNFDMYDGSPRHTSTLAQTIGWLGEGYKPKYSKYSGVDGTPTNLPN